MRRSPLEVQSFAKSGESPSPCGGECLSRCARGLGFSNHRNLRLTRSPVSRPASRMRNSDDLNVVAAYPIHDKERKAAK